MKILLVRPKPHKATIGLQSVMICEPLELMVLAAVLRANNHMVVIVDMILERRSIEHYIRKETPDIVGITGYISHVGVIKEYARKVKEINKSVIVCVGGVHATVCPLDFTDPHIDNVCQSSEEFYKIAGCTDQTPRFPDRSLLERCSDKYYYLFQTSCALLKASYGCPYNCNFCFCKEIMPYYARPITEVVEELLTIQQQEIYIVDDNFLYDRNRMLDFCEQLESQDIHKHFLVYGRADFIAANEDIIARLKKNGLTAVIVGLESASQYELDSYSKLTQLDDNIMAAKILRKHGIECYATVILGLDWDKADFTRLYHFLKSLDIVFVNLQPFTPMPGTSYFNQYKDRLLIPYDQLEKWDMAHLVVQPNKLSVRQYYLQIIKLYFRITVTPKHSAYMFRRYGWRQTMKLSAGAFRITLQYFAKIIGG